MSKIKIKDLPGDMKISRTEMKKIMGGVVTKDASVLSLFDFGEITPDARWCKDGSSKPDGSIFL
jgi:hypothetical protein